VSKAENGTKKKQLNCRIAALFAAQTGKSKKQDGTDDKVCYKHDLFFFFYIWTDIH
jgi:hypothetical protein